MRQHHFHIDLFSLAILFISLVCIGLAFISMLQEGTGVWVVLPPAALGVVAILGLEKK